MREHDNHDHSRPQTRQESASGDWDDRKVLGQIHFQDEIGISSECLIDEHLLD